MFTFNVSYQIRSVKIVWFSMLWADAVTVFRRGEDLGKDRLRETISMCQIVGSIKKMFSSHNTSLTVILQYNTNIGYSQLFEFLRRSACWLCHSRASLKLDNAAIGAEAAWARLTKCEQDSTKWGALTDSVTCSLPSAALGLRSLFPSNREDWHTLQVF